MSAKSSRLHPSRRPPGGERRWTRLHPSRRTARQREGANEAFGTKRACGPRLHHRGRIADHAGIAQRSYAASLYRYRTNNIFFSLILTIELLKLAFGRAIHPGFATAVIVLTLYLEIIALKIASGLDLTLQKALTTTLIWFILSCVIVLRAESRAAGEPPASDHADRESRPRASRRSSSVARPVQAASRRRPTTGARRRTRR